MNISEMSMDQATDAMIRVSAVLAFVLEDEEVKGFVDGIIESGNESILTIIPKYLPKFTNILFKRHKDALYELISALSQVDKKEVGKMTFKDAVSVLKENWSTLKDFFTLSEADRTSGE